MTRSRKPKSKPLVWAALVLALVLAAAAWVPPLFAVQRSHRLDEQRLLTVELADTAAASVSVAGLRRTPDGPIKTVDAAQLAIWAADAEDPAVFAELRRLLLDHFVIEAPDDPFTDGMVAWAWTPPAEGTVESPGEPLDASGTTEGLRTAEALLAGLDAEHPASEPGDADLAHKILRAYARHEVTESGLWYIRNYLNLQTRAFATNSFLIDYDPDLLARAADRFDDAALRDTADRSAALIRGCLTPAGLLHQMIRPEVATAMGPEYVIYSANGHEQLSLSLSVAERCVDTAPEVARSVLAFASDALKTRGFLHLRFRADTGEPVGERRAGIETYAPMVRLAAELGDRDAFDLALPLLFAQADEFLRNPTGDARIYILGETLLALRAAADFPPE